MKLYLKVAAMTFKTQMEYRSSFFMTLIGQFIVAFSSFLGVSFMFDRFGGVGGYRYEEVLICFAVMLMAFTAAEIFFRGFDLFPRLIRDGTFDRILLRPRNEIFQVMISLMDFTRFGRLLQAVCVLVYAVPACGVTWTADKILTLALMLLGASVVFASLFFLYAGISFFTIEGLEFMNILTDGGRDFGKYPFAIYGEGVLKFVTYIIPLALVQYYPFTYLVGRSEDWRLMLLPVCAMLFVLPCYAFWRLGVRHYNSAGS